MSLLNSRERFSYRMYKYAWAGLDLFFPPHCGGCNTSGSRWCSQCQLSVKKLPKTVCNLCGRPMPYLSECYTCESNTPSYDALRSWAFYEGPVRKAIHNLKYRGDMSLGEILAQPLVNLVTNICWDADLILPVPMGTKRISTRGFNHAALLTRPIAYAMGIPFTKKCLRKIRDTPTQVGLSLPVRLTNVKGAFLAEEKNIKGRRLILVDDVTTSGATMEACAIALREAGAAAVYGLTIARTRFSVMDYEYHV